MSDDIGGATLESLAEQIAGLTDLFRRRLLDDKAKQSVIEEMQARIDRAEKERAAESLRPLVTRVSLVVERIRSTPPSPELSDSLVEELEDVLGAFGVRAFGLGHAVDPRRHEIVSVEGEGPVLRAHELIRAGYEKDGIVLQPARITVVRVPPTDAPDEAADTAE